MSEISRAIRLHTKLSWENSFTRTEVDAERSRYACGTYLQDVLKALSSQTQQDRIDVFIGWGDFDTFQFPPNCIIIHRGDEQALPQNPHADGSLLLKEYGVRIKPLTLSNGLCSAGLSEVAYDVLRDTKAWLRGHQGQLVWSTIPIGYSNSVNREGGDFIDRQIDVSFAGSINHNERGSLKERVFFPKRTARRKMLDAMERLKNSTTLVVANHVTRHFADLAADDVTYSSLLNNTKIALAPRGTSRETFRHFEAAMAGCVVITEPLPDHWFYRDAPFVYLRNWKTLPDVVNELFADIDALRKKSEETSAWWETTCSPNVLTSTILNRWRQTIQSSVNK